MKKVLCLAVLATALAGAPAYAKGHGLNVAANVLTGRGGVVACSTARALSWSTPALPPASAACSVFCSVVAERWADCSAVAAAAVTDNHCTAADGSVLPLPSALSLACRGLL